MRKKQNYFGSPAYRVMGTPLLNLECMLDHSHFRTTIIFLLLLFLAGCADLVALPFGVVDTAVWVGTLGNVHMHTSRAVKDVIDPDRVERREAREEASRERYAFEQEAIKQNEKKSENSDNKQVASSQDKDPTLECLEKCFLMTHCDRVYSQNSEIHNNAIREYITSIHGIVGSGSRGTLDSAIKWSDYKERNMEKAERRLEERFNRCNSQLEACESSCQGN